MKTYFKFFGSFFFSILFSINFLVIAYPQNLNAEMVVIIHSVSKEKNSFVINLGKSEGISKGQESLFTNENISVKAQAKLVSRYYSLWELAEKKAYVPFVKESFVVFSNSTDNIYSEIPLLKTQFDMDTFIPRHYYLFRFYMTQGISESVSEAQSENQSSRRGYQFEGTFQWELNEKFSLAGGFRIDNEIATLTDPPLEVPTQRWMFIFDILYNFEKWKSSNKNLYGSLGLGVGKSTTTINEVVGSGSSWAIPILRIGMMSADFVKFNYFIEAVFESISVSENFEDGQKQSTTIVNGKIGFGVRF